MRSAASLPFCGEYRTHRKSTVRLPVVLWVSRHDAFANNGHDLCNLPAFMRHVRPEAVVCPRCDGDLLEVLESGLARHKHQVPNWNGREAELAGGSGLAGPY